MKNGNFTHQTASEEPEFDSLNYHIDVFLIQNRQQKQELVVLALHHQIAFTKLLDCRIPEPADNFLKTFAVHIFVIRNNGK